MIIGIIGKKGYGKDTLGDYLVENYNFIKYNFADPVKDISKIIFNLNYEQLYGSEKEVIDKFIALGGEASRFDQYGSSLSAIKEMFSSEDDRYKVIKNLAYIARADEFIHENEMKMIEQAVSDLDMEDKVSLVKTESTLFVDFKG